MNILHSGVYVLQKDNRWKKSKTSKNIKDTMYFIITNNEKQFYFNDKLHREDGPARIRYLNDDDEVDKYWYKHGELHRDKGPAIEYSNETYLWYKHGKLHREEGPAIIHDNGDEEFYINGVKIH